MTLENLKKRIDDSVWGSLITWIFRLATGAVFTFSGFVKAVDPWGTFYKFEDYLGAMSLSVPDTLTIAGVFILCGLEFLAGVALLTGSFRRLSVWVSALIMLIMLPLTFWLAVWNPVSDCGCFGDAVILSNWQTFWKNVVLTVMILWLLIFNKSIHWIITPALQWIGLVCGMSYFMYVSYIGYWDQPLIDFRPYKIGTSLVSETVSSEPEYVFVYERNGEKVEVDEDEELPDESQGWEFVDRIEKQSAINVTEAPEKALRFYDLDGDEDITESLDLSSGEHLIVLIPDLKRTSILSAWSLNSLYHLAKKQNIPMMASVYGNKTEILEWEDLFMPDYPVYSAEDTPMKEAARGNPSVIFTKDGNIVWKTSLQRLTAEELLEDSSDSKLATSISTQDYNFARWSVIYVSALSLLIFFSFIPPGWRLISGKRFRNGNKN